MYTKKSKRLSRIECLLSLLISLLVIVIGTFYSMNETFNWQIVIVLMPYIVIVIGSIRAMFFKQQSALHYSSYYLLLVPCVLINLLVFVLSEGMNHIDPMANTDIEHLKIIMIAIVSAIFTAMAIAIFITAIIEEQRTMTLEEKLKYYLQDKDMTEDKKAFIKDHLMKEEKKEFESDE